MCLLAVTGFGQLIGLPSSLFCFALIVYLLLAPSPRDDNPARVSISIFFVFVCLAFAAIWFWLSVALPMLVWIFILGDRNSWFWDRSSQIAAAAALLVTCVAFVRTMRGTVSPTYVAALKWAPPILLATAAAVSLENYLSIIEGFTADAAAQNIFKGATYHRSTSMRLVPHDGPPLYPPPPAEQKTFWVVEGDKKVGLIVVWRRWLPGWRLLRTHWFTDSRDLLVEAKMYLDRGDKANARYCLDQIIASLSGTPAEEEARHLLATKLNRR
jgi:hypothetical protein